MALEPGVRLGACGVSLFWCPGSSVRVVRLHAYKGLLISRVSDRLDFICGVFPRRAAARKILDDVSIRFFVLKIIFQILMDLHGMRDQAATA